MPESPYNFYPSIYRSVRRCICMLTLFAFLGNSVIPVANAAVSIPKGFYSYDTVDLGVQGSYPIYVLRHYQSADQEGIAITNSLGPFGPGTHMGLYSLKAEIVSDGSQRVRLYMPTGGAQYFILNTVTGLYVNANESDPIKGEISVSGSTITLRVENGTQA